MKKRDAYESNYTGRPSDVIKCETCSFRAVKGQFDDEAACPKCKTPTEVSAGKAKKKNIGA